MVLAFKQKPGFHIIVSNVKIVSATECFVKRSDDLDIVSNDPESLRQKRIDLPGGSVFSSSPVLVVPITWLKML